MRRHPGLFVLLPITLVALVLVQGERRYAGVGRRLEATAASLAQTRLQAAEVMNLRHREERVSLRERPRQDVIALVNEVLAEAGIPSGRLIGVEPESDVALGDSAGGKSPYRRQTLALSLERLTLPQVGRFLGVLRERQRMWSVTRIELSREGRPASGQGAASEPSLLGMRLLLSAVYVSSTPVNG
ncbi:MAG: hypothetical protein AB1486_31660 [Planctomycetota bacterium]